jgi:uncharacterized membrane protein
MRSHTETHESTAKLTDSLRLMGPGHIVFALAMSGLGVLGLVYGDFALQWQPIPQWLPWRQGLAYLSGVIMLLGGVGLFVKRIATRCAVVLLIYLLVSWVLPQALKVAGGPILSVGQWLGFCETLAVTTGAWILWASIPWQGSAADPFIASGSLRGAQCLFGVSCVIFGVSHFVYAGFTAGMVPHWLPLRLWFAYATGVGHIAAGLGILLAVRPRLAATLEALMMSSFVVLLHIPSLWTAPPPDWANSARIQWTALFWASALAGSAWIVARSFRGRPGGGRSARGSIGR